MAEQGISLREFRRIIQQQASGDEMPMIDLTFERLKRTLKRNILRQWDRLMILDALYENYRCPIAVQIIEQVYNLLIHFMNAEFESHVSLLQRADYQYQLRIELDTAMYHLTTAQTLGTNYLQECVTASISTETVVARVAHFLLKMEAIRDRLSGTMQSMTVGMALVEECG